MNLDDLGRLRKEYSRHALSESDVDLDPLVQFSCWFQESLRALVPEPNAMALATATEEGKPSVRMVLLKGYDERGFVFYTNYEGRKSSELFRNPNAALLFFWVELERQIRIEGTVEKTSRGESEEYFKARPLESRLGAWASRQSAVIPGRSDLEQKVLDLKERYAGREVPVPPFWGGFRLLPQVFEFWQGRENRLHDRIRYSLQGGVWVIERLSP
ncbi:MAG: pyridoxamine 5'-phosphate oxidase [Ignavibacteriales bacterium]|nr:pyridoxamine 5'-phosphate oxidase [Ignavibacteriales bacterium]